MLWNFFFLIFKYLLFLRETPYLSHSCAEGERPLVIADRRRLWILPKPVTTLGCAGSRFGEKNFSDSIDSAFTTNTERGNVVYVTSKALISRHGSDSLAARIHHWLVRAQSPPRLST
jgi:hypothetical protein